MKTLVAIVMTVFFTFGVASCASTPTVDDVTGEWTYSEEALGFDAYIEDDQIQIYVRLDDMEGLYWLGTFEDEVIDGTTVMSAADTDALELALLASLLEEKVFRYEDGKILFEYGILGTTTEVAMERAD